MMSSAAARAASCRISSTARATADVGLGWVVLPPRAATIRSNRSHRACASALASVRGPASSCSSPVSAAARAMASTRLGSGSLRIADVVREVLGRPSMRSSRNVHRLALNRAGAS